MPIEFAPPNPSLQGFQIPAPQSTDPLQTLAQIGQLRTQGLQQQVGQQELETGGIKLQQAREDMADQQKLRQVYQNWMQSGNPKVDDLLTQAGAAGVGPRTLMPLQQQITEQRLKLANAKDSEYKNTVSGQAQTTQALNAVASAPPDQRGAAWQTERQNLIAGGFATPDQIPPDYPGDAAFEELRHHNRTQEQEIAIAKDQREAGLQGAQTAEAKQKVDVGERAQAVAEVQAAPVDSQTGAPTPAAMADIQQRHPKVVLPRGPASKDDIARLVRSQVDAKDQPEYDLKLTQAAAMKNLMTTSPQALEAQVDDIVPPSDPMNAKTKSLVRGAISRGDFPAVQQIFKDAYDQQGRTATAVATEVATTPYKVQQQVATAKALRQGDNPELAGVAPAAVVGVQNQAIKLDEQYSKEKAATEALGRVLDLAMSGNKAAGSNLPLMGVETLNAINGIKRVNSAEIHQYTQAGSLWDQIVGRVDKLTVGQPIPQNILNDMRTLHQTLGQQSYQNYTDSLKAINARSGASLSPKIEPPNISRGAAAPGGPPGTVAVPLKNGNILWLPPAGAAKFRTEHPERVK